MDRRPEDRIAAMQARAGALQKVLAPHAERARRAKARGAAAHGADLAALVAREEIRHLQAELRALAADLDCPSAP